MEIRNIHKHSGWFSSYMYAVNGGSDAQGRALVECQAKKIKQLTELIENIKGEIELTEDPKECDEKIIIQSIKTLINQIGEVESTYSFYKWVG